MHTSPAVGAATVFYTVRNTKLSQSFNASGANNMALTDYRYRAYTFTSSVRYENVAPRASSWTNYDRNVARSTDKMLKSVSPQYPVRAGGTRVIRLTVDQEAVLQEQFNRWPRAPHTADVVLLAAETGLSEADVEAWYAIRLAQWRKEQGLGGNLGLH